MQASHQLSADPRLALACAFSSKRLARISFVQQLKATSECDAGSSPYDGDAIYCRLAVARGRGGVGIAELCDPAADSGTHTRGVVRESSWPYRYDGRRDVYGRARRDVRLGQPEFPPSDREQPTTEETPSGDRQGR